VIKEDITAAKPYSFGRDYKAFYFAEFHPGLGSSFL